MRTSREDLKVETTSDEKQQRKTKLQSLVNAQMQIVGTQKKLEKNIFPIYEAFPLTKSEEFILCYKAAAGYGFTIFSKGRQKDNDILKERNTFIETSLSRDKDKWVNNQMEVMAEMRRRFK